MKDEIIPIGKPSRLTAKPANVKNKNKKNNAKQKPLESEEGDEEVSTTGQILLEKTLRVVPNKPLLPSWPKGVQYGQKMKVGANRYPPSTTRVEEQK